VTEPRERSKKAVKETEEQAVKPVEEVQEQVEPTREAEEKAVSPLDEVLGRAERAYATYMEAQQQVARAYRQRWRNYRAGL